jgi:thiol:disulfide interchange protein
MICYLLTLSSEYCLIYNFLGEKKLKNHQTYKFAIIMCFFLFQSYGNSEKSFSLEKLISVDQAFKVSVSLMEKIPKILFKIHSDSYIYSEHLTIKTDNHDVDYEIVGQIKEVNDEFFGISEIYDQNFFIVLKNIDRLIGKEILLSYQGCLKNILCYPKITKKILITKSKNNLNSFKFL